MLNENTDKTVALIAPFYNLNQMLAACLDSLIAQSYPHLCIVLVNDGSDDDSLRLAKEYALKDERIIIIDKENGGQSSARNAALELLMQTQTLVKKGILEGFEVLGVKGANPLKIKGIYKNPKQSIQEPAYIQFVDGDDVLERDCVAECVERMIGADVLWFDYQISSTIALKKIPPSQMRIFSYAEEGFITRAQWFERAQIKPLFWFVWQGMIDFSFLKKIKLKFINGIIYEDHCFGILLFMRAETIYLYPQKKYLYQIHPNSTMNPLNEISPRSYNYDLFKACGDFESFKAYQWARSWILSSAYMMDYFKENSQEDFEKMRTYFLSIFLDKSLSLLFMAKDPLNLKDLLAGFKAHLQKHPLSAAECVRQGLAYRLGFAFLSAYKNPRALISLPFTLWKIYRRFSREQEIFQNNLSNFPYIHFDKNDENLEVRKIKKHLSYKIGRILCLFIPSSNKINI